jgi:hypothetical protein
MEILRTIGEKLEKWGQNILIKSLVKDLGITSEPVNKMGMERLVKAYDQYFENLMSLPPNELQAFVNEKLEKIPEDRRTLARQIIQQGMRRYLAKREEERYKPLY